MVDGKALARAGFKYLGRSYKEMDCQAFVEKCLKDCGNNTNLSGSNAWYRRMTWTGSPEECKRKFGSIPAGAFIYILEFDGGEVKKGYHDGLGNASHIGLITGTGEGAIHSSQSRGGVYESKFKGKSINGGWNRIGLWKEVEYENSIVNAVLHGGTYQPSSDSGSVDAPVEQKPSESVAASDPVLVLPKTAIVTLPAGTGGSTVKMRKKPTTQCALYDKVPVGAQVEMLQKGATWTKIVYGRRHGWYMMTKFLKMEE